MNIYAAYNLNEDIRKNSSSGGIFYSLAEYILSKNGIVFGAAGNKNWLVDMCYIDKLIDLPKLIGSKYIQANLKETFKECKEFLETGRLVLYSGLPCQLHGLKTYLKKDYKNLILVDIACHGLLPLQIGKDYLETIKRPDTEITSINFRLKEPDGNNYAFEVKYSDGRILKEHHRKNKYMQAFLCDKYLKASCYDCKFKNNFSCADITIGDAGSANTNFDSKNGISFIIVRTTIGESLLNNLDIKKDKIIYNDPSKNGCLKNKIDTKPCLYNKDIFKKKVGIITLHLINNFGGILQAYALQTVIKDLGYTCETLTGKDNSMLPFASKNMNLRIFNVSQDIAKINETDYDIIVVGSDQIGRKQFITGDFKNTYLYIPYLGFTNHWTINRLSYAASIGVSGADGEYTPDECRIILETLKFFNGVSVREIQSEDEARKKFGKNEIIQTVDPTLLLNREQYEQLCKAIPENKVDVFAYVLDSTDQKKEIISQYCAKHNYTLKYNDANSIETGLAAFRDAKYIITDSFHGCIFSIIFNKPFICLYNKWRGGARFESLLQLLNTRSNIIYDITELSNIHFDTKLTYDLLQERIQKSKEYLINTIAQPGLTMQSSNIILPTRQVQDTIIKTQQNKQDKTKNRQNYLYF